MCQKGGWFEPYEFQSSVAVHEDIKCCNTQLKAERDFATEAAVTIYYWALLVKLFRRPPTGNLNFVPPPYQPLIVGIHASSWKL